MRVGAILDLSGKEGKNLDLANTKQTSQEKHIYFINGYRKVSICSVCFSKIEIDLN